MKNKFLLIKIYLILSFFLFSNLNSEETFTFNVSEIQITDDGNIFKGINGGEAYTEDGTSITAENFTYNKFHLIDLRIKLSFKSRFQILIFFKIRYTNILDVLTTYTACYRFFYLFRRAYASIEFYSWLKYHRFFWNQL